MFLSEAIDLSLKAEKAFVSVRLAGEKLPQSAFKVLVKKEPSEQNSCFVFIPFDTNSAGSFYLEMLETVRGFDVEIGAMSPKSQSETITSACEDCWEKEAYLSVAAHLIDKMQSKQLEKIVLSRKISFQPRRAISWGTIYLQLCSQYPNAYVYFISNGDGQTWMGASPETLVRIEDGRGETMALAGTQSLRDRKIEDVVWNTKEIEEQGYVAQFIRNRLRALNVEGLYESQVHTVQAGPLAHLRTNFDFFLPAELGLDDLARSLHPTPAICGLPVKVALHQILEAEPHLRLYYSGYAGLRENRKTGIYFVNLRCLQLLGDAAYLYVGGGLTADSDPVQEWEETIAKADVLLSVIAKYS